MIIGGKHIADDRYERFICASWDRRRPTYYRREHHTRFLRRIWNRQAAAYRWGDHADRVWTKWMGRVRIVRSK